MSEVNSRLAEPGTPEAEFSMYGEVEVVELPRVKRISGRHLAHSWNTVPHVTHHDYADITELEALRRTLREKSGVRFTVVSAVMRAVAGALQAFPNLNASLGRDETRLILKRYVHIGMAIETPRGLLVGVVRDCDAKSVVEIAREAAELADRGRSRGLNVAEMSGGCFTISSLGGIGGTAFTPIVNAPELAILGLSRSEEHPRKNIDGGIEWRLRLPLSLSYDHRVVDGAEAARFLNHIIEALGRPDVLLAGA